MRNKKGTIIIVGASSGLGREIAKIYAECGWKVGVCARREERLKELCDIFPQNMSYRQLDVTDPQSDTDFEKFVENMGGMDIFLYAAGCGWNNPSLQKDFDERTVDVNVVGFTRIVNAAFKWFGKNNPAGQLCAITSIAGTKGIGISATYSASKRYENTYLESLAQLARHDGLRIQITDIRPGFIDTDLLETKSHHYPMLMTPRYASRRIVKAIMKRKAVAYIDWRWRLVVWGWKLIPRWLWIRLKLKI